MKIGAIVQARMSSNRFPGKVLHEVARKPMLEYLLERLQHCPCLADIVVATSVEDSDTPIADYCRQNSVSCYRGSLNNVADRFKQVLDLYHFDGFVRVTGDSPLLDQRLIERSVAIFLDGDFEIVTNGLECTYPKGQSVEILRTATYQSAYARIQQPDDLEHVTKYFYEHAEDFKIHNFTLPENLNHIRLCVDTRQDMDNITRIVSRMEGPHWEYRLGDVLRIYRSLN